MTIFLLKLSVLLPLLYLLYTKFTKIIDIFLTTDELQLISFGVTLFFLFSISFSILRRERRFYWLISFLLTLVVLPSLIGQRELILIELKSRISQSNYQCPRSSNKTGGLNFGEGYQTVTDSGQKNNTNIDLGLLKIEDENIERPCVGRYKGEPLFHYITRRLELMFLEYKFDKKIAKKNKLEKLWYSLKHFKSWSYNIPPALRKANVYVFYKEEFNKKHLKTLLLDDSVYKTNLNETNVEYIKYTGQCRDIAKRHFDMFFDVKSHQCEKLNHKNIVHFCSDAGEALDEESLNPSLDYNNCLESNEKNYSKLLIGDVTNPHICNLNSIRSNIRLICIDNLNKKELLKNSSGFEVPLVFFDPSQPYLLGVKKLADLLFDYREDIILGESYEFEPTGSLLDKYDKYFDDSDDFQFIKLEKILKTTRMRQFKTLKELD